MVIKLITVFLLGMIEIWLSIPAGFALGLNPVVIGLVTAIGGMAGVTVITLVGVRTRDWFKRRRKKVRKKGSGRAKRVWDRYGAIGFGLLAPFVTGSPAIGTVIGIGLGASRRQLLIWMNIGVLVWSVLLTAAVALGIAGVDAIRR